MREHLRMRHNYRKLLFGMDDDEPMTKLDAQHYLNYTGTDFSGPSVTLDKNEGLDAAQKCILKWFLRTGFSMHHVRQLMAPQKFRNSNGTIRELPPVIEPDVSFKRIRDC